MSELPGFLMFTVVQGSSDLIHLLGGFLRPGVRTAMDEFATKYDRVQAQGLIMIQQLLEKLLQSFAPLALSEWQEQQILDLVEQEVRELIAIYDFGDENQQALRTLLEHLSGLMGSDAAGQNG